MFTVDRSAIAEGYKYILSQDGVVLSYQNFINFLSSNKAFRTFLSTVFKEVEFQAWRWECPPVDLNRMGNAFEFVILNSPFLNVSTDQISFESQFSGYTELAKEFINLGADALLIAPTPISDSRIYSHIGIFSRAGSSKQVDALWQKVGEALKTRLSQRPVWLSTSGAGVAWLHVRIDDSPKYYGYSAYRKA